MLQLDQRLDRRFPHAFPSPPYPLYPNKSPQSNERSLNKPRREAASGRRHGHHRRSLRSGRGRERERQRQRGSDRSELRGGGKSVCERAIPMPNFFFPFLFFSAFGREPKRRKKRNPTLLSGINELCDPLQESERLRECEERKRTRDRG